MNDTSNTTNAASQSDIPQSVSDFMQHITDLCGGEHARWAENFNAGFANTLTTTVRRHDDGTTFLLTGDIPAMWLRDSSAQFRPYLAVAVDDPELTALITGLVRQQFRFINIDPYANAFNEKTQRRYLGSERSDRFVRTMVVGTQIRGGLPVLPHSAGVAVVSQYRNHQPFR